jgi:hypothetical protein
MKTLRAFLADESGATAIEYGLIAPAESETRYSRILGCLRM